MLTMPRLSRDVGAALLSVLLLAVTPSASTAGYQPPADATPPDARTSSTGRRSCGVSQHGVQLMTLAPKSHVGQAVSSHPTFVWFVPVDTPLEGEFWLWKIVGEKKVARVLDTPLRFQSSHGLMTYTLPAEMDGLTPNNDYIWQVSLRCGDRPSDTFNVRSQLRIVDAAERSLPSPDTEPVDQARQFAEVGLWYDALGLVSTADASAEADAVQKSLLRDLAEIDGAVPLTSIRTDESLVEGFTDGIDSEVIESDSAPTIADAEPRPVASEGILTPSQALRLIATMAVPYPQSPTSANAAQ